MDLEAQGSFFYLALRHVPEGVGSLSYLDIRSWCRSLSGVNGGLPSWVDALKRASSSEQSIGLLHGALGEAAPLAGEGVFLAFLRRRWALGRLRQDAICRILLAMSASASPGLRDALRSRGELGEAIYSGDGLEDMRSISEEIDAHLVALFQAYEPFDALIPSTLW